MWYGQTGAGPGMLLKWVPSKLFFKKKAIFIIYT